MKKKLALLSLLVPIGFFGVGQKYYLSYILIFIGALFYGRLLYLLKNK
jgi:hypothetical protein